VIFFSKPILATSVLGIKIEPASPVYDQPFTCTLTLDQDDHRNACCLMPLNSPEGTVPWDICRIDTVSGATRNYKCIANTTKNVPSPGDYQIAVWNFTGDGETGQVIAKQNITILDKPPPTPTEVPRPTPTDTPPEPTVIKATQIPIQKPTTIPTIIEFSISPPGAGGKENIPTPTNRPINISLSILKNIALPIGMINQIKQQIGNGTTFVIKRTQNSLLRPFVILILNFMREASY